jgi:hypothetical protein
MLGGIIVFGSWGAWFFIIVDYPVSMPVSLAVGEVKTPEFRIYVDKYYSIEIEAKKHLSLEVLDCMLGISTGPHDSRNCQPGVQPLLQANWTLLRNGQIVDQGSSEDHRNAGGEVVPPVVES